MARRLSVLVVFVLVSACGGGEISDAHDEAVNDARVEFARLDIDASLALIDPANNEPPSEYDVEIQVDKVTTALAGEPGDAEVPSQGKTVRAFLAEFANDLDKWPRLAQRVDRVREGLD